MGAMEQHKCHVKESLFQFINDNIPNADLSAIDDIVLSYVISILEEASKDPCLDLEPFIEMMTAYIPKFASIDSSLICSWVINLEAALSQLDEPDNMSTHDEAEGCDKLTLALQILNEMLPPKSRSHSNSENSENDPTERRCLLNREEYVEQCQALLEMFPNTGVMEIKHCMSIASGDAERACSTLLHRRELGLAHTAAALHAAAKQPTCDDKELKSRIIARYSYVDKNQAAKEHKPLAPKIEPKKMVRYRDNKIVSLKGERYTEVPKSGVDEDLKKPKKNHCP